MAVRRSPLIKLIRKLVYNERLGTRGDPVVHHGLIPCIQDSTVSDISYQLAALWPAHRRFTTDTITFGTSTRSFRFQRLIGPLLSLRRLWFQRVFRTAFATREWLSPCALPTSVRCRTVFCVLSLSLWQYGNSKMMMMMMMMAPRILATSQPATERRWETIICTMLSLRLIANSFFSYTRQTNGYIFSIIVHESIYSVPAHCYRLPYS